jgi:hypothetical protein
MPKVEPPTIASDQDYAQRLGDLETWEPLARAALDLAGIPQPAHVQIAHPLGTYPTLLASTRPRLVIKLFGDHHDGRQRHAAEHSAYQVLARPRPARASAGGRRRPLPRPARLAVAVPGRHRAARPALRHACRPPRPGPAGRNRPVAWPVAPPPPRPTAASRQHPRAPGIIVGPVRGPAAPAPPRSGRRPSPLGLAPRPPVRPARRLAPRPRAAGRPEPAAGVRARRPPRRARLRRPRQRDPAWRHRLHRRLRWRSALRPGRAALQRLPARCDPAQRLPGRLRVGHRRDDWPQEMLAFTLLHDFNMFRADMRLERFTTLDELAHTIWGRS